MKKSALFLIGLMASLVIGISTAQAQVFYTLEDIGVVKDMDYSMPAALNSFGSVVGTAYGEEYPMCAFHYDYLQKFIHEEGSPNSRAFGINSASMIVGDAFPAVPMEPRSHATLWKDGVPRDLGVLKNQAYSRANGINAMGQVVGYSSLQRDSSESRAFMWSKQTGMIDLGTLGGGYAQANAINDAGFITGTSETPAMLFPTTHAFIYSPAVCFSCAPMTDLGVLGGNSSYGMAINGYNHVAGYSTLIANDTRVHAFLHNGSKMIDLGSLGSKGTSSDTSVALGVNNFDLVVGSTYLPTPTRGGIPLQQVAFLWRPNRGGGQMINLNTLLLPSDRQHYLLVSATAINDNGQIVAVAYDLQSGGVRALLLTQQGPAPVLPARH